MRFPTIYHIEHDKAEQAKSFLAQLVIRHTQIHGHLNLADIEKLTGWFMLVMIGLFLGFLIGPSVGHYVGIGYAEYFGPFYFSEFSDFAEFIYWKELPTRFAAKGQAIGSVAGMILAISLVISYSKLVSIRTRR